MKGTRSWLKKRRQRSERYLRVYGYVQEWQLELWRRRQQALQRRLREDLAEAGR